MVYSSIMGDYMQKLETFIFLILFGLFIALAYQTVSALTLVKPSVELIVKSKLSGEF